MHQAAAAEDEVAGTAIAATSSVSLIAAIASGSKTSASAGPRPMLKRLHENSEERRNQEKRQDHDAERDERGSDRPRFRNRRTGGALMDCCLQPLPNLL